MTVAEIELTTGTIAAPALATKYPTSDPISDQFRYDESVTVAVPLGAFGICAYQEDGIVY